MTLDTWMVLACPIMSCSFGSTVVRYVVTFTCTISIVLSSWCHCTFYIFFLLVSYCRGPQCAPGNPITAEPALPVSRERFLEPEPASLPERINSLPPIEIPHTKK